MKQQTSVHLTEARAEAASRARPEFSLARRLSLIGSLYLAQAMPMGFVFGSMPVILRLEGIPLRQIGLLFLLHLPWALKLFYASRMEALGSGPLGRRKSWIVPLQWLAAALLFWASRLSVDGDFLFIFSLLLLYNVAMATGDIAVDGYATDILSVEELRWGATLQASGRFVGMILGGGLFLMLYTTQGWAVVCGLLALCTLLLSLPTLFRPEIAPTRPPQGKDEGEELAGLRDLLRLPRMRWAMPVLILPTSLFFCGFQLRLPLMADLGLGAQELGSLLMRLAYPAGLLGALASGWLLRRVGPLVFLRGFCARALSVTAASAWLAQSRDLATWQAAMLLGCDNALLGAANVWAYTLIMGLSRGKRAGTGVAILGSLFILPPLLLAPGVGAFGDAVGFPGLYAVMGVLMVALWGLTEAANAAARRRGLGILDGPPRA